MSVPTAPLSQRTCLALLLALAACESATSTVSSSALPPVQIESYVERNQIRAGDQVMFRVVVEYQNGLDLDIRDDADALAELPILKKGTETGRPIPGRTETTQWYLLQPMKAEVLKLPAFEAVYSIPGDEPVSVSTESVFLNVTRGTKGSKDEDIRDVWNPAPFEELPWVVLGLGALALVGFALVGWRLLSRRSEPPRRPLTPEEQVREALTQLAAIDVSHQSGAREFCFGLTVAMKSYLEALCDINASDMTTPEISSAIENTRLPREHRIEFVQLMRAADRVKYAGDAAHVDELRRLHQVATRFVDRAQPEPIHDLPARASS